VNGLLKEHPVTFQLVKAGHWLTEKLNLSPKKPEDVRVLRPSLSRYDEEPHAPLVQYEDLRQSRQSRVLRSPSASFKDWWIGVMVLVTVGTAGKSNGK
jgi:hypothetical protein